MSKTGDKIKNGFYLGEAEWGKLLEATKNCLKNFKRSYCWPLPPKNGKNEPETINEFKGYSENLKKYVKNQDQGILKDEKGNIITPIDQILAWGGITNRTGEVEDFKKTVCNKEFQDIVYNWKQEKELDNVLEEGKKDSNWRIAAWSKILAAYKPGTFFIYDSRVAIALSHITLQVKEIPCFWQIPPPKFDTEKPSENAKKKKDNFGKFKGRCEKDRTNKGFGSKTATIPACYDLYLKLLRKLAEDKKFSDNILDKETRKAYETAKFSEEQAIMAHLEKMLFMMKDDIIKPEDDSK